MLNDAVAKTCTSAVNEKSSTVAHVSRSLQFTKLSTNKVNDAQAQLF
jgi:hypothetical protein